MKLGVPTTVIALMAILITGCAGNEIVPAASAAPTPGNGDPLAALYAMPADAAYITVSDIEADIVGPDGLPFDPFYGYGYAAELVVPFADYDSAWGAPFETLDLALAEPEAVAPPLHVDIDAAYIAAAAADSPPLVWERGPEVQQPPAGWEAPPLDAK